MRNAALTILAVGLVLALAGAASAAVTTVALYHMGEDGDNPNVKLIAAVGTDAAMGSWNNTESIETGTTGALGSTKYLSNDRSAWTPGLTYLYNRANNWGMSAWLKLPDGPLAGQQYVSDSWWAMSNGNYNANSIGMSRPNGVTTWNIGHGDIVAVDPALYGTWAHVALVYNGNNNAQLYVNGELLGSRATNASFRGDAAGHFWIGTWNANSNVGRGAKGYDEVQVFSFDAGQFDISDVYKINIPEPATMSLLVIGGVAALIRRRRK
ncbi:MAG: LamG-like jellyroll fold domain-containing protein [Planctomycetaceae bacterium]|nr:PEP-CTERM sorting domain-containing protein [Planctomycetaceae bacterium]